MTRLLRIWRIVRRFQEVAHERKHEPSIQPYITCPVCGKTSYHPQDIKEKYCGACHWWTGREDLLADRLEYWVQKYAREHEMPNGCPLPPTLLKAIVLVLQRK